MPLQGTRNNRVEICIRPIALERQNWLFDRKLARGHAGRRAAAVMSLIQSAALNGLDPHAYLRDVLERLPTQAAVWRTCCRIVGSQLTELP